MLKLLVTCVGRRVELIKQLKEELDKVKGKLICADMDRNAPALYYGHSHIINTGYSYEKYCKAEKITHITTLIDTLLVNMVMMKTDYLRANTKILLSHPEIITDCFDKLAFYNKYKDKLNLAPCRSVIKDQYGSSASGFRLIQQPFIDGKEYNVQLYFDFLTGDLCEVFMQEKILMRAGETERAVSCWDETILGEVLKLQGMGFKGAIDIDIIKSNDKAYLIDINPRFGGGYPMAHACGVNFIKALVRNMQGVENIDFQHKYQKCSYQTGKTMMKYDTLYIAEG